MKKSMPKIRKIFALVFAMCLLFSLALTGCGQQEPAVDDPKPDDGGNSSNVNNDPAPTDEPLPEVTLKIAMLDSGYGSAWIEYAIEKFTEEHPNVTFDLTCSPTIGELISTKAAAGNDEDMYDIFYGVSGEYITAGKAEPITDVFQMTLDDTNGKTIDEVILAGFNNPSSYINGENYNLPITYYVGGMFYDQDFFAANGWNTQPKTYDEFLELCQTIKDAGVTPIVHAGLYNYNMFAFDTKEFELALENGNTEYMDNYKNYNGPVYTTPESIEVYTRLYDMAKKGYISEQSVGMTHTQSQMLVLQNQAAMCPSGDWIEGEMADAVPEGYKWGFMAVPFTNDTSVPVHITGGLSYNIMMWKDKPDINKQYSKEFLASLYSLDVQEQLAIAGANPMRTDYASDPSRTENLTPMKQSIADYMANVNSVLEMHLRNISLTDEDYVAALTFISSNAQMVAAGQWEPMELLQPAEDLIQKSIAAYKEAN